VYICKEQIQNYITMEYGYDKTLLSLLSKQDLVDMLNIHIKNLNECYTTKESYYAMDIKNELLKRESI